MTASTTPADRAQAALARLKDRFPGGSTSLSWSTPWELLVAVMLSAQCTDALVNKVTPGLFARWPGPAELARAETVDIDAAIGSVGFHRSKAKRLKETARLVAARPGGQIPRSLVELVALPGVGRKTANVVLNTAFDIHEGIAVDTHVKRLAFRLGLTASDKPEAVERDLTPLFPPEDWGAVNHLFILHGRATCRARRPRCPDCLLADPAPGAASRRSRRRPRRPAPGRRDRGEGPFHFQRTARPREPEVSAPWKDF